MSEIYFKKRERQKDWGRDEAGLAWMVVHVSDRNERGHYNINFCIFFQIFP